MAEENEKFREQKELFEEILKLRDKINSSTTEYINFLKDVTKLQASININEQKISSLLDKENKLNEKLKKHQDGKIVLTKDELDLINKKLTKLKISRGIIEKENDELKKGAEILKETLKISSLRKAVLSDIGKSIKSQVKNLWNQRRALFEQTKISRELSANMGFIGEQGKLISKNLYSATIMASKYGGTLKDVAAIQASFTDNVGRALSISDETLSTLGAISKLGMGDAVGDFVGLADQFLVSTEKASKLLNDAVIDSQKHGVAVSKTLKFIGKNLKVITKYNFKDGFEGLTKMAAEAEKLKISFDGISSMAEKAFRPEGAVEMAAQLNVMGGQFAQLGDAFSLLYKSRYEFDQLAKDVANITKEFVTINERTGEMEISGLQRDRMREIARITNIGYEQLVEMSLASKRMDEVRKRFRVDLNEENRKFIEGIAEYDSIQKKWVAKVGKQTLDIKKLTNKRVKALRGELKSAEDLAAYSQTAMDMWENIKNSLKVLILPFLDGITDGLKEPVKEFMKLLKNGKTFKPLYDFGNMIGKFIGLLPKIASTVVNLFSGDKIKGELVKSMVIGGGILAAGITGAISGLKYAYYGYQMGIAFLNVVKAGMKGGGVGSGFGLADLFGFGNKNKKGKSKVTGKPKPKITAKGVLKGIGGALAFDLASLGIDYMRSKSENPDSDAWKAGGVLSSTLSGLGYASMIAPFLGPYAPIAYAIGGLGGLGYGLYKEFSPKPVEDGPSLGGRPMFANDLILRPNEPPIILNKNDQVVAAKKDGPIDKALSNDNNTVSKLSLEFSKPLSIVGNISINNGMGGNINVENSPELIKSLTLLISEEIRKQLNGGVLKPI
jgi:hypothetical protein